MHGGITDNESEFCFEEQVYNLLHIIILGDIGEILGDGGYKAL